MLPSDLHFIAHISNIMLGGGVNVTTNRTEWPLGGGSLLITPSHSWSITFVNLGIGSDDTVIFNISMIEGFNQTGNGTFCFPKIPIPQGLGLTSGSNASIQVVQVNEHGSALYNVNFLSHFPSSFHVISVCVYLNRTIMRISMLPRTDIIFVWI